MGATPVVQYVGGLENDFESLPTTYDPETGVSPGYFYLFIDNQRDGSFQGRLIDLHGPSQVSGTLSKSKISFRTERQTNFKAVRQTDKGIEYFAGLWHTANAGQTEEPKAFIMRSLQQ